MLCTPWEISPIWIRQNTHYKKKHRICGAILSHQQSLCYLWTHHHCNSAIKLINLGVSCFLQEHLRWRNHPWRLAYQGPYLYYFWIYGVHAFIWNDFSPTKTWGSSNSFGYSFWTILPFENPFGCNKIAKKIPNKLAHQVNQTKQAKQTHQPTRPTRTIRCNRPTRPTRTIKPAMEIFSQFHNSKFTPPKAAPNYARLGAGCQVIL